MRRILTGVDDAGRSCVVSESVLTFAESMPGVAMEPLYATEQSPPPARPAGHGDLLDLEVAPGLVRWMAVRFEPDADFPNHHTDTVDFDTVLEGSMTLLLDDGAHPLAPGDVVVMTGVDHAWRSGPDGCLMSVLAVGTPPTP